MSIITFLAGILYVFNPAQSESIQDFQFESLSRLPWSEIVNLFSKWLGFARKRTFVLARNRTEMYKMKFNSNSFRSDKKLRLITKSSRKTIQCQVTDKRQITQAHKNFFFLSRGFQYDILMYFFPLKPNPQPVEPLHVRILT